MLLALMKAAGEAFQPGSLLAKGRMSGAGAEACLLPPRARSGGRERPGTSLWRWCPNISSGGRHKKLKMGCQRMAPQGCCPARRSRSAGGWQPPLSLAGIASSAAEMEGEGPGLQRAPCGSKPSAA